MQITIDKIASIQTIHYFIEKDITFLEKGAPRVSKGILKAILDLGYLD